MSEFLKAYIDGELPADQMQKVEQALQRDASLRAEFDQLRRISSTFRESAVTPVAAGLDKTLTALKKKPIVKRSPLLRIAPAVGLAFAGCLALVVVNQWMGRQPKFDDEVPSALPRHHKGKADSNREAALNNVQFGADYDDTIVVRAPADRSAGGGLSKAQTRSLQEDPSMTPPAAWDNSGTQKNGITLNSRAVSGHALPSIPEEEAVTAKKIVKTAQLALTVTNGKAASDAATKLATRVGGYVESSDLTGDDEQGMTGSLTLRVPVAKFEQAMAELQKLGKVTGVSSNGQDVTAAVADDAARLNAMKIQEQSYLKILTQAKHIDDVLAVKDRVDNVQQEIESLTAELKRMSKQADMSTISLTVNQKPAVKKVAAAGPAKDDWLNKSWNTAFTGLASAGKTLAQAFIFFVVFCPVWIPLVVLANLLARRMRLAS